MLGFPLALSVLWDDPQFLGGPGTGAAFVGTLVAWARGVSLPSAQLPRNLPNWLRIVTTGSGLKCVVRVRQRVR